VLSIDISVPESVMKEGYDTKKPDHGYRVQEVKFADSQEGPKEYSVPVKGRVGFKHFKKVQHALQGYFIQSNIEQYRCDNCLNRGRCTQQFYIKDPPKFLILQLRRFNLFVDPPIKINTKIINDLIVDLSPYVMTEGKQVPECYYKLYGLVEHSGTLSGGHYVAYTMYEPDKKDTWYYISDSHVSNSSKEYILNNAQGFLLFYEKLDL